MQDLGERMEFCPKCGSLMIPKKEGKKLILVCRNCGYIMEEAEVKGYRLRRRPKHKEEPPVVEEELVKLPTTRVTCPSCGHNKAYWWMRQTRGADEPSTRFYRCVECGHVWREYS